MPWRPSPARSNERPWNISKRSRPWEGPSRRSNPVSFSRRLLKAPISTRRRSKPRKRIVVGINQFQAEEEPLRDILRIRPEMERYQKEKLARVKKERDSRRVKETLAVLKQAAQGTENLVPPILEAVRIYATLGEISDTLRDVFGEYRER